MRHNCLIPTIAVLLATQTLAQTPPDSTEQPPPALAPAAAEFSTKVRAITSSASSAERMAALATLLDNLDVTYQVESFELGGQQGKNLIVKLGPESDRKILVGAHFDQVKVGQGAVDNACSCAVLIEMIEEFKAAPLENHALEIVFFDLEEVGLLGSKAYIATREQDQLPDQFINLDIFGYGDALWLMSEEPKSVLPVAFEEVGRQFAIPVIVSGLKQYPPGDHVPFTESRVPTLAVALIDEQEIDSVKSLLQGQRGDLPPILRIIHTPDDTVAKIEAWQCAKALPVVEAAIRRLDQKAAGEK